jgi:hypothetical protein
VVRHVTHPVHLPLLNYLHAQLPAWGVIVLGCYALYSIGLGLYNFGDPGSAAEDLQQVRRRCGSAGRVTGDTRARLMRPCAADPHPPRSHVYASTVTRSQDIIEAKKGLKAKGFKDA